MGCSEIKPRMVAASPLKRVGAQAERVLCQRLLSSKSGGMHAPSIRYIESVDPKDAVEVCRILNLW